MDLQNAVLQVKSRNECKSEGLSEQLIICRSMCNIRLKNMAMIYGIYWKMKMVIVCYFIPFSRRNEVDCHQSNTSSSFMEVVAVWTYRDTAGFTLCLFLTGWQVAALRFIRKPRWCIALLIWPASENPVAAIMIMVECLGCGQLLYVLSCTSIIDGSRLRVRDHWTTWPTDRMVACGIVTLRIGTFRCRP